MIGCVEFENIEKQDKVLQALKYFRTHATEEQKKEALALLEKDCKADVTFKDYDDSIDEF